jgi:hypothetical protein
MKTFSRKKKRNSKNLEWLDSYCIITYKAEWQNTASWNDSTCHRDSWTKLGRARYHQKKELCRCRRSHLRTKPHDHHDHHVSELSLSETKPVIVKPQQMPRRRANLQVSGCSWMCKRVRCMGWASTGRISHYWGLHVPVIMGRQFFWCIEHHTFCYAKRKPDWFLSVWYAYRL